MVNHGFSTAALFLVVGFLISRRGSRLVADFGGVQKVAPVLAGTFLVAGLSASRCPGCRRSSASSWCWSARTRATAAAAIIATAGIVLAALYILLMYQRTMTGPSRNERTAKLPDLDVREVLGRRPADRGDRRARLLPEAAARRDQPGGRPHASTRSASPTLSQPTAPAAEGAGE